MKSMKKILSLVIALAMVLSLAPLAMASAGDDGMGGVETEYFWDDFQSVEAESFPIIIGAGETVNGWKRNGYDADKQQYSIELEDTNKYLKFTNLTGHANQRELAKALKEEIPAGSNVRITLKFKYDTDALNVFGFSFLGKDFFFRTNKRGFYPGDAEQFHQDHSKIAIEPGVWNNIELLLLSKEDADYYEYYKEGNLISAEKFPNRLSAGSAIELKQSSGNSGIGYNTSKSVYFDDIKITTVDEKRICELAAERISIPSSATGDITLPSSVDYGGATISWASDNTSLISNSGVVTRPENGDIVPVTLTATVTYGQTSVAYPYTVNVLPHTVPFYEDFEGAAIGDVAGYNNWSEVRRRGYNDGTLCWDWNIKQEAANKSANVVQTVDKSGLGDKVNSNYVARKFDEISGKSASVTFKFKSDSSLNHLELVLLGNNTKYFVFRMNDRTITDGGGHLNGGTETKFRNNSLNIYHTARLDLDLVEGMYDLYVDGVQLANDYKYNGGTALTSLNGVGLSLIYSNWGGVGSSVDFDDIVVTTGKAEYPYSIADFAFKDADGEASLYPEAGGSVAGVTINKYDTAENAALIAAVYDGGKLTKASTPIDVTGAPINTETTYPVSLPIASENTQIRVFVLDKGTLVPLALDKTYEERSPITVFIAGDSMAEVVKKDDGTLGYQREGWGMRIGEQFEGITVSNHAVGGRDTAEFISEGRLNSILAKGQRGDFVFVSFGTNDDGANMTLEDYRANLEAYSKAIKEKGMTPIFITSIARISRDADDAQNWVPGQTELDNLYEYAEAMVNEAAENGDVCLDLYTAFNNKLSGMTYAQAREYYVPKEIDGTHLSTEGAILAASLIAELLGESASTLKDLLK